MKNMSFPDNRVNQIRVPIKLVLYNVVEYFQKKEDKMMIVRAGKEEPGSAESFQKMK